METQALVRKLQVTRNYSPPDQVQGDGRQGVEEQGGELGVVLACHIFNSKLPNILDCAFGTSLFKLFQYDNS